MCELENMIFETDGYKKVCKLDYSTPVVAGKERQCTSTHPYSVAAAFYGTETPRDCVRLSEERVRAVRGDMYSAMADPATSLQYAYFMSAAFDPASHNFTERTRSTVMLGAPLDGYSSAQEEEDEQRKVYQEFYEEVEQKLWTRFGLSHTFFESACASRARGGGGGRDRAGQPAHRGVPPSPPHPRRRGRGGERRAPVQVVCRRVPEHGV